MSDKPPTLQAATRWIAIKGRFQGRKADGHPGAEVLLHGLQKLDVAIEIYLIYHPEERVGWHDELKWTPCPGQFYPEFKLHWLPRLQRLGAAPARHGGRSGP